MALRVSVRVEVPQEILDSREVVQSIIRAQQRHTAPGLKKMFGKTVEGWHNKPDWLQHQTIEPSRIAMEVWAGGENADQYALVNEGAPRHEIPPKNPGGFLRFRPGYRAGTRPRVLASHSFSRFGSYISSRGIVDPPHPGFEGRKFDETIAEEYADVFAGEMADAIDDVARNP